MVKGPKGDLSVPLPDGIGLKQEGGNIILGAQDGSSAALHGLARATIANAVSGVSIGWSKSLELVGVGFRANLVGANLQLSVGFSHPVVITPPPGITFAVVEGKIVVSGVDRHLVGQTAANIRAVKKPEPYKGKGIRYEGEQVRRKAGKTGV
jgi:large subunit ribosomal protein L6